MKKKNKRSWGKRLAGFLIFLAALAAVILWIDWGNRTPTVSEFSVSGTEIPEAFSGFRIAQISDLHNAEFGKENKELLSLLSASEPDMIVLTGDLVDANRTDLEIAIAFCREAVEIAPTYFVTGNHEAGLSSRRTLMSALEEVGVTVLKNKRVEIERDGEFITLIGLHDLGFTPGEPDAVTREALTKCMKDEDGFTVLLAHRPELFDVYTECGVDLVFSGHAHGGQFRLPFVGGLYAPTQGWFPTYDGGLYAAGGTTMVVSRGLGNSRFPFRINNRPEVVVVELITK